MHKTLQRQLKRSLGIGDEAELSALLATLQAEATHAAPALRPLLAGFGDLLSKVGASYEQYDRDLELRTRSLEISSAELSSANDKLRHSLRDHENALDSLRQSIHDLLPEEERNTVASLADEDIAALSERIAAVIAENELGRRELANQKFALDQHAIVSITDRQGTILYANDRFCEISGYPREFLIGKNHRIINSGTHPPALFQDMWQTITAGHVWRGEVCNRTAGGGHYWVSATIVPLLGVDGDPERYIAIRTDISDRKRMEAQLSEQLHLVEELIETIPLPIYLKDTEGRYVRLNRAFEAFFQVRRESFIGRTLHDLLPPEDARLHAEKDTELFARRGTQSYEAIVHSRDGVIHNALYHKAILTRRDGSVSGLLGTIVDITDRKRAEVEILHAKEAAEAASRAKSDFLANMSHEIRTPMNGVIGMTDLALDTPLNPEQREYLSIVKSSAESLLTIINDILDFSKIEAGKLLVENIPFDLHRLIADTLKPLALRAHETGLELLNDVPPDIPRYVHGDPSRIRQVLVNLVGNAIKFTQRGEVALSAELMRQQDGQGSTFHFSIALRLGDKSAGIATTAVDVAGHHILIVDDNATNRRILRGMLAALQISTTDVASGEEALALMQSGLEHFDCILLDAHMPGLDGYELARRLHGEHPDLPPMLMLSSGALRGDALRCQESGIAGFFSKPIASDELVAALGRLFAPHTAASKPDKQPLLTRHSLRETSQALRILLVEDHPTNQKLALGLLTKWWHDAVLAHNGQEALDILATQSFDLILMDMQMPVMGGIEATRHIRAREALQNGRRTPIIAMTAAAMQDDRDACLAAGMDDYVSKPIKVNELQETLAAHSRTT